MKGPEAYDYVASCYRDSFEPMLDKPIYEWAEEVLEMDPSSPIPGKYRIRFTPWMREPLDAFKDESIRHIVSLGPNQGGRTKGMEAAAYWTIKNRPGPTQWNTDHNDKAKDFAEDRFWPSIENIAEITKMFPSNHDKKRLQKIIWNNGVPFVMQGANLSNFQQKSVLNQFNDEVFKWKQGLVFDAHKRCDVSYAWAHKIWDNSVPGDSDSDLQDLWDKSSRGEWSFECRSCKTVQPFQWEQLRWDTNETTKPGGVSYDYEELAKTVRYECANPGCNECYKDSPLERRAMNDTGRYVHADPKCKWRGFRYNILCVNWPGVAWINWIQEFHEARRAARVSYNLEPLRLFWTRRMTEFWEEDKFLGRIETRKTSDYDLREPGNPKAPNFYIANKWDEEEWGRFLSVDKQEHNYPFVIRAAKKDGSTRLIDTGVLSSYVEIEEQRKLFGVVPNSVIIDAGFESHEVYAAAIKYGWTCMMGEQRDKGYLHQIKDDTTGDVKKVIRPYSELKWGDPSMGTTMQQRNRGVRLGRVKLARLYMFSNLLVKNMLAGLKSGRTTTYWGTPRDAGQDYFSQLNAEVRYRITNSKGFVTYFWSNAGRDGKKAKKPNHAFDCECQIVVALMMAGLLPYHDIIPDDQKEAADLESEALQEAA